MRRRRFSGGVDDIRSVTSVVVVLIKQKQMQRKELLYGLHYFADVGVASALLLLFYLLFTIRLVEKGGGDRHGLEVVDGWLGGLEGEVLLRLAAQQRGNRLS